MEAQVKRSGFLAYFQNKQGEWDHSLLLRNAPEANEMVGIIEHFTLEYKRYHDNINQREVACMAAQLPGRVRPIQSEDLFAGRMDQMPIGLTPQSKGSGMGYCMHPNLDAMLVSDKSLTTESRERLAEIIRFWHKNATVAKSLAALPPEITSLISSPYYYLESGIAFILYRMSGVQMDYHKLLKLGLNGLKEEIIHYQTRDPKNDLYDCMIQMLDLMSELCLFYAAQAHFLAEETNKEPRKSELKTMAEVLTNIASQPPATFREGLQLMYLYNKLDGAKNYGRMDDYLGDLYAQDLEAGRIDEEEAVRLLSAIWRLMIARDNRYDTRLIIGGKGRYNEQNADKVALLIMETTRRVADIVPQVALRFYKGQNPALYQNGLDVLATGNTFPMLYNDEVNVPAAMQAFDIPESEANHIIQYGCGEYVLNHRSVGTPSGVINLLKALLVTMNRGIDPTSGKPMGMPLDRYLKYNNFETFNDLFEAYKEQVEHYVYPLALHEKLEYDHAASDNPYLLTSMLMDDCIARGKSVYNGGIRHLGGTLETYGNTNVADSLVAIKEWVYDKEAFSLSDLLGYLKADFEGFTKERNLLLSSPKYGNDHPVADAMLQDVHDHICITTRNQAKIVGLDSYLVVVINNDANTIMGTFTTASPDGRKAFVHLNPGNNPMSGADRSGITSFLNSLVKPATQIHAGAVQNMKFSKEMLTKNRSMFEILMATYFENGGAQAMLTVIGRGDLEAAMERPQDFQNLIVRVGGFSERFVNLPRHTQLEVLSRTLN